MKKKQVSMFLCALLTLAQVVPAFAGVQADEGIVVEEAIAEEEVQAVAAEEEIEAVAAEEAEAAEEAIEAIAEEEIQAVAAEEETEKSAEETSEAEEATGEMDTLGDFELGYYDIGEGLFVGSLGDDRYEVYEITGNSAKLTVDAMYYLEDGSDVSKCLGSVDVTFDKNHTFNEKAENLNGGDVTMKQFMADIEKAKPSTINVMLTGYFNDDSSLSLNLGCLAYGNRGDRYVWMAYSSGTSSNADGRDDYLGDYYVHSSYAPVYPSQKYEGIDGIIVADCDKSATIKFYDIFEESARCFSEVEIKAEKTRDEASGGYPFYFTSEDEAMKTVLDDYTGKPVVYAVDSEAGYSELEVYTIYPHKASNWSNVKLNKTVISWADGSTPDYTYDGQPHVPAINVAIHGDAVDSSDYTVEYYVKGKKVAPEEVTEAGKVTIKIVPSAGSDAKGSKTKTYKIKPRNLAASNKGLADIFTSTVNGGDDVPCDISGAKPGITISYNGVGALEEGTDFTVKYSGNKKVAEGSLTNNKSPRITVKGKGNYTGTAIVPFTIVQQDMDNLSGETIYNDVVNIPTGKAAAKLKNKPVIKNGNKKLKEGRDYTVTYTVSGNELDVSKNHSYADGTVVDVLIEAKKDASGNYTGNFKGVLELSYSISNKLIKNNMIVLDAGTKCDPANVEAFCSHVKVMDKIGGQKSEISHEYYNVIPTGVEPEVIAKGKNKGKVKVSVFVLGTGTEYGGKIIKTYIVEKAE